jgi:hypothetical protein
MFCEIPIKKHHYTFTMGTATSTPREDSKQDSEVLQKMFSHFQNHDSQSMLQLLESKEVRYLGDSVLRGKMFFGKFGSVYQCGGYYGDNGYVSMNIFHFVELLFEYAGSPISSTIITKELFDTSRTLYASIPCGKQEYYDTPNRCVKYNYTKCAVSVEGAKPIWLAFLFTILDSLDTYMKDPNNKCSSGRQNFKSEWGKVFSRLVDLSHCTLNDTIFNEPVYNLMFSTNDESMVTHYCHNPNELNRQREYHKNNLKQNNLKHLTLNGLGYDRSIYMDDFNKIIGRENVLIKLHSDTYNLNRFLLRAKQYELLLFNAGMKLGPNEKAYLFELSEYDVPTEYAGKLIAAFVDRGVSITEKDSKGKYCFEVALQHGHKHVFMYYLQNYDLTKYIDAANLMIQAIVCFKGDTEVITALLDKAIPSSVVTACEHGHFHLIDLFVKRCGTQCLYFTNDQHATPLHAVCKNLNRSDAFKAAYTLIDHKMPVNPKKYGGNLLSIIFESKNTKSCDKKQLTELITRIVQEDLTVLTDDDIMKKVITNISYLPFIQVMLDLHRTHEVKTNNSLIVDAFSVRDPDNTYYKLDPNVVADIINMLLDYNPDVSYVHYYDKYTVLHRIANMQVEGECKKLYALVRRIAELDTKLVNKQDSHGCTPLHYAVTSVKKLDIIQALLDAGADKTVRDKKEFTARNIAAQNKQAAIVELLSNA